MTNMTKVEQKAARYMDPEHLAEAKAKIAVLFDVKELCINAENGDELINVMRPLVNSLIDIELALKRELSGVDSDAISKVVSKSTAQETI
jgi:hypothetical protein